MLLVGLRLSEDEGAASVPLTASATTSSTFSASSDCASRTAASSSTSSRPTARVRAGKELHEQLLKVFRLRNRHKIKEADELFQSLDNTPMEASAIAKEDGLSRHRVRELRDCCFSLGGLSLTRRVLERFLNMPEVRMLLPEAVSQARQEAVDASTSKLLLETAKDFLTKIFKARLAGKEKGGGRRSDENRNAFAAALAALLPADLFQNRRGRSAMRILGINYRQARMGSRVRSDLEDWGRGWKRIKTQHHADKVRVVIVWHTHNTRVRSDCMCSRSRTRAGGLWHCE